ncbi:MAG: helix-turn-helix domain-containing protein [Eggerthellaceae bacterium]|nr:helix-turn-helix domain-containing protein [Eggerthellaceae bacterium]
MANIPHIASSGMFEEYPDLLTPNHLSEITGMTAHYIRKMCRNGDLPAVQVGKARWYVPKCRFIEYVMGGEGE